jgi:hypothetical protein
MLGLAFFIAMLGVIVVSVIVIMLSVFIMSVVAPLTLTNTLAYYNMVLITFVKCFVLRAPLFLTNKIYQQIMLELSKFIAKFGRHW